MGAIVLVVRSSQATGDEAIKDVASVDIKTSRIEVVYSESPVGGETRLVVDDSERSFSILDQARDVVVAQLPVPVGYVHQIRLFPRSVVVRLQSGELIDMPAPGPDLPSWPQSGWKLEPADGIPWSIVDNELTGVRALFRFDDEMNWNKGIGYQIQPTCPAEGFEVNPPGGGPGLYFDQLTVVFVEGTTPDQVDAINATIGSTVLLAPLFSTAYRIKLSPNEDLGSAFRFYNSRPEVQGVLPAINYASFALDPGEGTQGGQMQVNLPEAWQTVNNAIGSVGSRRVRVAVVDDGVDIVHRDLYRNIAINQGEIPPDLNVVDTDGDGVISFVDLNDSANDPVRPPDINGTGYIDGADLLASNRWADGNDDDHNGLVDDLVGWDFADRDNDPSPGIIEEHGTGVAGLVGAEGNNGFGIAGASWNLSIVPIRFKSDQVFGSDQRLIDALKYLDVGRLEVDVAVMAAGWQLASENADLHCADAAQCVSHQIELVPCGSLDVSRDKPQDEFDDGLASATRAYRTSPFYDTSTGLPASRVLYVFAAGNSALNLADRNVVLTPGELIQNVMGNDRVLIVGAATRYLPGFNSETYSNYGSPVVNLWAPAEFTTLRPEMDRITNDPFIGTSAAAPVVAGTAALPISLNPALSGAPDVLATRLIGSANPIVSVKAGGCDEVVATGQPLLDANAALGP